MATVDELIHQQLTDIKVMSRIVPNFKKLGQANFTAAIINRRIDQLKEIQSNILRRHSALRSLVTAKERTELDYYKTDHLNSALDKLDEALDYFAELLVSVSKPSCSPSVPSTSVGSAKNSRVKLPAIELPKFDGSYDKWETFRDRFVSLIVSDQCLSNFQKMHYLCSALTGEPSEAISHLNITEANFDIAWNLIKEQYDNERRIIMNHLQTLLSLPPVRPNSVKSLRSLRDTINSTIQALKKLNRPVTQWDDILVYLVITKLDSAARNVLELKLSESTKFPEFSVIDNFLSSRIRMLDALPQCQSSENRQTKISSSSTTVNKLSCIACKQHHPLYQCTVFLEYPISRRRQIISDNKRCFNCFRSGHSANMCSSPYRCRECNKKHHTLLHLSGESSLNANAPSFKAPNAVAPVEKTESQPHVNGLNAIGDSPGSSVLLATAMVRVYSPSGQYVQVRALLDQGSEATFISDNLVQSLNLSCNEADTIIIGIGGSKSVSRKATPISIGSVHAHVPKYPTVAFVLPNVTSYSASHISKTTKWSHIKDLLLADYNPFRGDPCELIIGADLYGSLLRKGLRVGQPNEPVAQNTVLGWILSGKTSSTNKSNVIPVYHVTSTQLNFDLQRFWEIENLSAEVPLHPNDQLCENYFVSSHKRNADGRYVVRLPFKTGERPSLPSSYETALLNLSRLEKRLDRDPTRKEEYHAFMKEYEVLNHMSKVSANEISTVPEPYYIPHHAVIRETSTTTKLRVVFNASSKTSNGHSLNDYLSTGQKLQVDLAPIIMRWRQFRFVLTADITKMYRQIQIHPDDADYQRILWRYSSDSPVESYRLLTVTYGTASAPFLALRTLKQLAIDEGKNFPLAVQVIEEQTYVDDCIFGSNNFQRAIETRDQLISIYQRGGFHLHKWESNDPALLPRSHTSRTRNSGEKCIGSNETIKILGISWHPKGDEFVFKFNPRQISIVTKRTILSMIASLFDPLGWLAPVIIVAKILMQKLWQMSCDWDEELPINIRDEWREYRSQFSCLESVSIPRWTRIHSDCVVELHGFADASEKAYAAVVYLRIIDNTGEIKISLVAAKTRVAPIKVISIPRLELCAALLLSELMVYVREALRLPFISGYCWSDSSVTLAWLHQPSATWKPFVAHRVAKIHELCTTFTWHYVPTEHNPADCASRGIYPKEILNHPLWWAGPLWLLCDVNSWPQPLHSNRVGTTLEKRSAVSSANSIPRTPWSLQTRYSSWKKLLRVTAVMLRFIQCIKVRLPRCYPTNVDISSTAAIISAETVDRARIFWIKRIQYELFSAEILAIQAGKPISSSSSIVALCPYLDSKGVLRVQGRLKYAPWLEDKKHPIILRDHYLVRLIVVDSHIRLLHAGPQLTLSHLRETYWILRARQLVRLILYKCIPCVRAKANLSEQFMADLPSVRVTTTTRAFLHTGIDYAGPILTRVAKGRGRKTMKSYIAVFICMTTKAMHLELVTDYSTDAFIAAYKRFASRRGLPIALYSDNGTNFRGAERELSESYNHCLRDDRFAKYLAMERTEWHFIPPGAPHFGGLWEAAVKSVKTHLKRCIGVHALTYEEFMTLLCCIEACLNSRPLSATSESLDDYNVLTPAHFLIQGSLVTPPEPSLLDIGENRLSRWQLIRLLHERFWNVWQKEYLHTLQQRPKWRVKNELIKIGQLVLLKDSRLPPSHWSLARIIECHPGSDGLVRVVSVKTPNATYKRPITQLCFLPIDINQANNSTNS